MRLTIQSQRGFALALVLLMCAGCGTTGSQAGKSAAPASQQGQQGEFVELELTPAQEAHAAALAHYATALSLATSQGVPAALPEYRQAFDLDPGNLALALWLSEIYRTQRDPTNAFEVLDLAVKNNPRSGEPWVARGLFYRGNDDSTNAIASFRQALKVEPTHYGAVRALIETYLGQADTNAVVALLDQSFRQSSKEANYWIVLGDLYGLVLRNKPSLASRLDRNRSRQCYEKALALSPKDPDILARVGDAEMGANDFQAAAEAYGKLIEVRPNIPQLRERLAAIYLKTEQKEKAIALYKELIKRDPLRFEFYNVLGELSDNLEHPDESLNYYEQSLKLNPEQPDAYLAIYELQHHLKHIDEALKTLETWKKKFPVDWRVPYCEAFIATEQKNFTKAMAAYADAETLAREAPQEVELSAQFFFGYGSACERANETEKAAKYFRKAIELNPKFASAYNYLGYMWTEKGTNLTESAELIQKAIELEPDTGAYLDSLGWVLYKLGRTEEAVPHLRRAIELLEKEENRDKEDRRDDAVVYDHLAEVLLKLGKQAEAVQTWRRAVEIDPGNKDIADKLQKYSINHTSAPK